MWKDQCVMKPGFSRRTSWNTEETEWARTLRERRAAGMQVLDLTASNPTRCGFEYDAARLLQPLADASALEYDPDPRGMLRARESVSNYYASHGAQVDPTQIFLSTSTSEAYSYLFRLLCDPGDEVLIAQPSYPLFDFLADLDDVRLIACSLFYDYGWHLDLQSLREKITSRTRAIALVHPNNPTGHFSTLEERSQLETVCREHGLALIVDEVFLDYPLGDGAVPSFALGDHPTLTFVLSGLSKIAALPQMKAAWIACFGPEPALAEAMKRLEVIADTFLSMNAPIQCALPAWLRESGNLREQIRRRTSGNLAALDQALAAQTLVSRLRVDAGWYAVLRVPAIAGDEEISLRLLLERGIAVHTGRFFGFPGSGWLVVSLLTRAEVFRAGIDGIVGYFSSLDVCT
jgi:alanine-synthesizing transaminase